MDGQKIKDIVKKNIDKTLISTSFDKPKHRLITYINKLYQIAINSECHDDDRLSSYYLICGIEQAAEACHNDDLVYLVQEVALIAQCAIEELWLCPETHEEWFEYIENEEKSLDKLPVQNIIPAKNEYSNIEL